MRVLAFTRYAREAASTRQRLLQFWPSFAQAGISVDVQPLLSDDYVRSLAGGPSVGKGVIARWYANRLAQLGKAGDYDLIWVYVELFPFLPASIDGLIFRSGKPVIFDFDDAFFVSYDQSPNPMLRRLLGGKLGRLLKQASAVTCGNEYLRDYGANFCNRSIVVPTVVNTETYVPVTRDPTRAPVIGWIGSPTTWTNVHPILGVLQSLAGSHGVKFRAVGAGPQARADLFDGMELVDWSEAREIAEVQQFDIGIMPLRDLPFQRGKSGYKLVQYMACGVPAVASSVGVNATILDHGECGLLANTEEQWREALSRLIESPTLRAELGRRGRKRAVERYSLASQAPRLVELFRSVASAR